MFHGDKKYSTNVAESEKNCITENVFYVINVSTIFK